MQVERVGLWKIPFGDFCDPFRTLFGQKLGFGHILDRFAQNIQIAILSKDIQVETPHFWWFSTFGIVEKHTKTRVSAPGRPFDTNFGLVWASVLQGMVRLAPSKKNQKISVLILCCDSKMGKKNTRAERFWPISGLMLPLGGLIAKTGSAILGRNGPKWQKTAFWPSLTHFQPNFLRHNLNLW